MVDYNSEQYGAYNNVVFNHIVELNKDSSYFCAGRDYATQRIYLFLYLKNQNKLYVREGHRWQLIEDKAICSKISGFMAEDRDTKKIYQFFKTFLGIKRPPMTF